MHKFSNLALFKSYSHTLIDSQIQRHQFTVESKMYCFLSHQFIIIQTQSHAFSSTFKVIK